MPEKVKWKGSQAGSQLWVDAVIDPSETRSWISMGIDMANQSPTKEKFNMGVLQV